MSTLIRVLGAEECGTFAGGLGDLLADAVAGGASVGFAAGLTAGDAATWWRETVVPKVAAGGVILFGAFLVGELTGEIEIERELVGTVHLVLPSYPNGRRRAEVAKLLVGSRWRRRGIAGELMREAEKGAAADGRRLLILDTETDSDAERLYLKLGWEVAGMVPDFFIGRDGGLHPSTFMYRRLSPPDAGSG